MTLTFYRWMLCLYPGSYRGEFADEMTSVFLAAQSTLPPALAAKISFYRREFCGLLSGAVRAHFDRLFGPAIPFRRFDMQPQFRFPRSTVLLMLVIFAGTVLTIAKASSIAGARPGSITACFEGAPSKSNISSSVLAKRSRFVRCGLVKSMPC